MSGEFAGTLRETVMIEKRLGDRDILAGATGRYLYGGTARVAVIPAGLGAVIVGDAPSAEPRWRVVMRKREGIDQRIRLSWRGRYLAVRGVLSDPREPAQMILTCEEVR